MLEERKLLKKIYNQVETDEKTLCFRYTGSNNGKEYGRIWAHGKNHSVHRLMYQIFHGPIPEGQEVHHACAVRDEEVYVREEIEAPPDAVWPLLRDFGAPSAWARGKVIRTEGTGIGMLRHVESPDGPVMERCEAHDETAMTFTYRVLESPWPFTNYVGTVRLTASAPGTTTIEWSATLDTEPGAGDRVRSAIESVYRDSFIAQLRDSVERKIREDEG